MELGIDGAALIREAHGRRAQEESLQESLRRVVQEKYPEHTEEVLRATKLLVDMMTLLEGNNAKRINEQLLEGKYRLSMVLEVPPKGGGAVRPPRLNMAKNVPCPRCGGEYLPEFNYCVVCGSLWPKSKRGFRLKLPRAARRQ